MLWRVRRSRLLGSKLMAEAGILKELAGFGDMLFVHENATRQDADRSFKHAHVAVEHDMRNLGAVEQRLDNVDQNRVIGANELAQRILLQGSVERPPGAGCCR